ncbi:MAG TPA: hypothetical protein VGD67_23330 [Pseudonocardiaceae bacterium]
MREAPDLMPPGRHANRSGGPGSSDGAVAAIPFPALLLAFDVKGFGATRNPEQLSTREFMYGVLNGALRAGRLRPPQFTTEDRGDGVLVVFTAAVPKPVVAGPVLTALLRGFARATAPRAPMVRVAAHAGEVHRDLHGFAGSDVNHVFRLLDAPVLRRALESAPHRTALLVSDPLYLSTVRHEYPGTEPREFHRAVVDTKEGPAPAWLHIPGAGHVAHRLATTSGPDPGPGPDAGRPAPAGPSIGAGRDITASNGGIIAAGDVSGIPLTGHPAGPATRRRP